MHKEFTLQVIQQILNKSGTDLCFQSKTFIDTYIPLTIIVPNMNTLHQNNAKGVCVTTQTDEFQEYLTWTFKFNVIINNQWKFQQLSSSLAQN